MYFNGPKPYTGRRFERFAGGGDRPETVNRFTSDDLVAVSLLGLEIPGAAAIEILETRPEEINEQLELIPADVDLWDAGTNLIGRESPAWALWRELTRVHQVGETRASKLMARKRPRLIPVYDSAVKLAVGSPENWWAMFHLALRDSRLRDRFEEIRAESQVGGDISLLRILDVAIWMANPHEQTGEEPD